MNEYHYNIKITSSQKNQGYVEGTIDDYAWFAIVHEEPMETGIDIGTLDRGTGRVTRLCIFKDSSAVEGNPYLPSLSIKRLIFANYQREWSILNSSYKEMVKELIAYLERRGTMKVVK